MHTVTGMRNRIFIFSAAVLVAGLGLGAAHLAFLDGLFPGRALSRASGYVRQVMQIVNVNYVDAGPAAYDELARDAIHGIVDSLDPHSEYLDKADNADLQEDLNGEFGGVGVEVEARLGRIVVIAPSPGGPSERAGIRRGDEITSVDGRPIPANLTMDDVVRRLRGKPGTAVAVELFRPATGRRFGVRLVREIIKVASVTRARVLDGDIGYLAITEFSQHTGEQFDGAVDRLLKEDIGALVIDLRNNPGGLLEAAVDVVEPFFRKGELIVYTRGRKPSDREDFKSDADGEPLNLPIAVLINSGTASAAEIVTGALKDTHRAVIVGERSFGKGSVQTLFKLRDGEGLRLTTARYFTPSGVVIHGRGIEPQVEVVMTTEEDDNLREQYARAAPADMAGAKGTPGFIPAADRQLRAAVDILKGVERLEEEAGSPQAGKAAADAGRAGLPRLSNADNHGTGPFSWSGAGRSPSRWREG